MQFIARFLQSSISGNLERRLLHVNYLVNILAEIFGVVCNNHLFYRLLKFSTEHSICVIYFIPCFFHKSGQVLIVNFILEHSKNSHLPPLCFIVDVKWIFEVILLLGWWKGAQKWNFAFSGRIRGIHRTELISKIIWSVSLRSEWRKRGVCMQSHVNALGQSFIFRRTLPS